MKILVTGSATPFARTLLPRLLAEPRVEQVIGIDLDDPVIEHENYNHVLLDPASPQVARPLAQCDTVIDLAVHAALEGHGPLAKRAEAASQTIEHLSELAASGSLAAFIMLSSALVYAPLRERVGEWQARRTDATGLLGALVTSEQWLDKFDQQKDFRVVRLRSHFMIGPNSTSCLARLLEGRFAPAGEAATRSLHGVHEDDVAEAILLALFRDVRGAFNLACGKPAPIGKLMRARNWLRLPMPWKVIETRLARCGQAAREAMLLPLALDTTRARHDLGWAPKYDTLLSAAKENG